MRYWESYHLGVLDIYRIICSQYADGKVLYNQKMVDGKEVESPNFLPVILPRILRDIEDGLDRKLNDDR